MSFASIRGLTGTLLRRHRGGVHLLSGMTPLRGYSTLKEYPKFVAIRFDLGEEAHVQREGNFHYSWLRDHSPESVDPSSGQKLHSSADIPVNISPRTMEILAKTRQLRIEWHDGRVSLYDLGWLKDHIYPGGYQRRFPTSLKPKLWKVAEL